MEPVTLEDALGLSRGSVLVCIPGGAADELTLATARSVVAHTDRSTPILLLGGRIEGLAGALADIEGEHGMLAAALDQSAGATEAVNAVARISDPGDLVLVAPGIAVGAGWLERLQAAAVSDSTVASATPLSLGEGGIELGADARSSDGSLHPKDEPARLVSERALRLHPRIATAGPGCVYIRRAAIELTGPLDEALPLEAALADMAVRAIAAGMVHVAADDVLVDGSARGSPPAGEQRSPVAAGAGQLQETLEGDERGTLRRAMAVARMALRGISVTIDGRALTSVVGGTQTYILDLIMGLAAEPDVSVRVLVPPDLSSRAAEALASVPDVELLSYEQAIEGVPLTDVVHRPQSVFTFDDLSLLRLTGERVVIGQMDLIAYHNNSYHSDVEGWRAYRRTTRLALGGADQVVFFSEHARADALAEDLLPQERAHVVGIGAEVLAGSVSPGTRPERLTTEDPFLLCLGADYAHKNRPFAMELLGQLRELGWMGRLVLAGTHVPLGSSSEHERAFLERRPDLEQFIVDLGTVGEDEKNWLYGNARALVYPTLYEGFGLLPLEAARAGLPCLFAAQASLSELAGEAATLIPWSASASASAVLELLSDGPARERHLTQLRAVSAPSWSEVARSLVSVYELAVTAPSSEAAPRMWQELDREATSQRYQDAYHAFMARIATGLPLIDEGGLLNHSQQRGLMRVAARRRLGALLLGPLDLLGRPAARRGVDSDDAVGS